MTRPAPAACLAALLAASGCENGDLAVNPSAIQPVSGAVTHSDIEEGRWLERLHVDLEERGPAVGGEPAAPCFAATGAIMLL